MFSKIIVLALMAASVSAVLFEQCDDLFVTYKSDFKKKYGSDDEETKR